MFRVPDFCASEYNYPQMNADERRFLKQKFLSVLICVHLWKNCF